MSSPSKRGPRRPRKGSGTTGSTTSGRQLHQKVKTAKGRRLSSTRWLQRQLNDPYVAEAKKKGYRSRAAFKLIELDDRFNFLKPGMRVLDLGAAPGGWAQVVMERTKGGRVLAVDLQEIGPLPGAQVLQLDFLADDAETVLLEALDGSPDVVLSDMSPAATGHAATDHLRIVGLVEAAFDFACRALAPNGVFVAKVFQGGTEDTLLTLMKRRFATVKHAKPPSSRKQSAEMYVIAQGFRPDPGS